MDWSERKAAADCPVVVILPGLTGSSQTEYVKELVLASSKIGIRIAVFNNRGLGGMQLKVSELNVFETTFADFG